MSGFRPEPGRAGGRAATPSRRAAAVLSAGTLASGVLAYAFNVLAARALGPEEYGPVAVLWAAVFLTATVLFRPLEQTLSRGIAARSARGIETMPLVRSVLRLAIGLTAVVVLACLVAWQPITDGLFAGRAAFTAALIGGIVGYALSHLVRGVVCGARWFAGYGTLLLADGAVRLAVASPLLLIASPTLAAIAIAVAALGGAAAPFVIAGRSVRWAGGRRSASRGEVAEATRFALPVSGVAVCEQVLVSGGPLLVMLAGGADAAAAAAVVFAATMLVRAPVFLFQGAAAALLPSLTRLSALDHNAGFRQAVTRVVLVVSVVSGVLVTGALVAGPTAMRAVYGGAFAASRVDLALLSAGIGCYLVAATLSQAALARGLTAHALTTWAAGAGAFVVIELLLPGLPLHRVSVAFVAASALMAAVFAARRGWSTKDYPTASATLARRLAARDARARTVFRAMTASDSTRARPRLVSVLGARPEIIQAAPVTAALRGLVDEVLVHTGQHYDPAMSALQLADTELPEPAYNLEVGSCADEVQLQLSEERIGAVLDRERPAAVLVRGDTNGTLAGARAAAARNLPIIHVEAGLRSWRDEMPEERNRVLTDRVSDLLLAPTEAAQANLLAEEVRGEVHVTGDVMCDMLLRWAARLPAASSDGEYLLATVHRNYNTDDAARLAAALACLGAAPCRVLFPVHPRTRRRLAEAQLQVPANVQVLDPVSYSQMLVLERGARWIATDSGGVQREAYVWGVPCITLREETEWVETVLTGWNTLVGVDRDRFAEALRRPRPEERPPVFGDGRAAQRIAALVCGALGAETGGA